MIWLIMVGVTSIVSKMVQNDVAMATSRSVQQLSNELFHRLVTLDLFNPEGYGMVAHAIEIYADDLNLLMGRSFLVVLMPFLKLFDPGVRGFGRIMVLDVYGPSYETVNVGWAIPPVGELIANFYYPAVVFFYFFLGVACKFMYVCYQRAKSPAYLAFYGVLLPWLFLQQRGDFLNGNLYAAFIALSVSTAFWLCSSKTSCRQGGKLRLGERESSGGHKAPSVIVVNGHPPAEDIMKTLIPTVSFAWLRG